MSEVEVFKYEVEVPLVDAEGEPIREGSVLRNTKDGNQGVVIKIYRPGDLSILGLAVTGDIELQITPFTTRITNAYSEFVHIPDEDQTYDQRYLSFQKVLYDHDEDSHLSFDEGYAIHGILALLPDSIFDFNDGPWPESIDNALGFLAEHLSELKKEGKSC